MQREPAASQAGFGYGIGTSLAGFRRFWAVAEGINVFRRGASTIIGVGGNEIKGLKGSRRRRWGAVFDQHSHAGVAGSVTNGRFHFFRRMIGGSIADLRRVGTAVAVSRHQPSIVQHAIVQPNRSMTARLLAACGCTGRTRLSNHHFHFPNVLAARSILTAAPVATADPANAPSPLPRIATDLRWHPFLERARAFRAPTIFRCRL